jgi:hypothetical protein
MKKTVSAALTLLFAIGLFVAPAEVKAQQDPNNMIIESIELDQADIRDALKVLFRSTSLNYTVAPDVQGVITVSLKNVPFKTALRGILTQVDATWREEGNIFNVIRKPDPTAATGNTPELGNTSQAAEFFPPIVLLNDPQMILNILLDQADFSSEPETSSVPSISSNGGGFGGGSGGFGGGNGGFGGGSGGFGGGSGGFGGGFGGGSGGFGGGGFGGGGGGFGGGR